LWQTCDYRDPGIIGEPYFDVDDTKVFYLVSIHKWSFSAISALGAKM
jgi:hypothetical protein